MKKNIFLLSLILYLSLLSSCTVAYTSLNGELGSDTVEEKKNCVVAFSMQFENSHYTNTFGHEEASTEQATKRKDIYISATHDVLNEMGCQSSFVKDKSLSNFNIHIKEQLQLSALPQEWLTGLSLGIIPSWGTRKSEYIYEFSGDMQSQPHTYTVDTTSINHIYLTPVFWISFFAADAVKDYQDAIKNYVQSSYYKMKE